ncbi:class I SAM-dependent methyltransferase [Streptomyces sp. BA2]|uniref:class I SAM-dependent methyltransferase n=1 Tax=Streptomyces sp. BA2 TaxID=436595 RepID=UPI001325B109|nr:class I SAM-dependent methyltransferase [Streptomyces sp. BA2]MWA16236.1 methyltransferase [Streptomyces sp. BA2]
MTTYSTPATEALAEVLSGLTEVAAWQLVPSAAGDTLLVAGPATAEEGVSGAGSASATHAAASGDAAISGTDLTELPALMRLLDENALLTIARILDRTRLFRGPEPRTAAEVVNALGAVPRHAWIVRRWLRTLVDEGRLAHDPVAGGYRDLTAPDRAQHARARRTLDEARRGMGYPESMTRFFLAAADRLPLLLQDRTSLQGVLFPEGDTGTAEGNYRDSAPSRWANHAAADLIAQEAHRRENGGRPLRVLEAGAGVGGTTEAVLDAVRDARIDYLFTDVSHFFLQAARTRFGATPGLRTALFDINADPAVQGFAPGSHDVILAANVLHNARHAGRALAALRELLTPDGLLVLVESCRERYQALTSMYLLMSPQPDEEGWFTDLRAGQDRVFFSEEEWAKQLDAAGFRPLPVLPPAGHPLAALGQHVIAGRPSPGHGRPDPARVAQALARLPGAARPARVHAVDRVLPTTTSGATS